jgi:tripartite-type tricarboxylate transporter receptor subunit TctC
MIGQTYVAKSPPDGYTLLLAGASMAGARFVNANVTYDLLRDFTPISLIESSPFALVARPTLPVASVKDLIALARAQPGKLTFATLGAGQMPYWNAAQLHGMAKIEAVEVQYKSVGDAMADVIAGRVDYWFAPLSMAIGVKAFPSARGSPRRGSLPCPLLAADLAQHHGPGRHAAGGRRRPQQGDRPQPRQP